MNRFVLYRNDGLVAADAHTDDVYGAGADGLHDCAQNPTVKTVGGVVHDGDTASLDSVGSCSGIPSDSVRCGGYILRHYGKGYRLVGDNGIFISGYVIPRAEVFQKYGNMGQHELISHLYNLFGSSFTRYIKGFFAVVIMRDEHIEVFFDQAGLFRAFYCSAGGRFIISDTVIQLIDAGAPKVPDHVSLAMQALFHRVPGRYTVYRDIFKTTAADYFRLTGTTVSHSHYHTPGDLLAGDEPAAAPGIDEFSHLFRNNISEFNNFLKPASAVITLTGGKDSRTILAALLNTGIKPLGITYGSSQSRDAVYASMTARAAGISHTVIEPPAAMEWFEREAEAIIAGGNPEISIHRSHRRHAFAVAAETSGRNSAFHAGYMGGELLMGIYYDDLIFTDFLKKLWDGSPVKQLISERLNDYFIIADESLVKEVSERISELICTDMSLTRKMREFHALFEIGIPHHSQDINLSSYYWDYPSPDYLDTDFLELLFKSRYSFLHRNASTVNPFRRHELFRVNMGIQHLLSPELDSVPFGKRGFYNTTEYLRGPLPWSIVKSFRYLTDRKKYPPSFSYGREYEQFLSGALVQACSDNSPAGGFYDTGAAAARLAALRFPLSEKHLHKFSDIVTFSMMFGTRG